MLALLLPGCVLSPPAQVQPPPAASPNPIPQTSPTPGNISPTATPPPVPSLTASPLPSLTPSPVPTRTPSPSPIPTYLKLRGEVIIDQAVCHYGPGAPYLYKYGVYKGSNLEILRRMQGGNYVEVQAIGGHNACWVKSDYLKIKGDLSSLQPVQAEEVLLPPSPYYASPGGVSARRSGDEVRVSWNALELRAGDDSEQTPYIVEAVVCQKGQLVFIPAGSYKTTVTLLDEPGCPAPSHARFVAAEKHGYTRPAPVPWPTAEP